MRVSRLQGLREVCTAEGAVLCFDEVMTGFRIAKVRGPTRHVTQWSRRNTARH